MQIDLWHNMNWTQVFSTALCLSVCSLLALTASTLAVSKPFPSTISVQEAASISSIGKRASTQKLSVGGKHNAQTFLKFRVYGLPTQRRVTLELYSHYKIRPGLKVRLATGNWSGKTLRWRSRPKIKAAQQVTFTTDSGPGRVRIDVTKLIAKEGEYTLVLSLPKSQQALFAGRKQGGTLTPQLYIEDLSPTNPAKEPPPITTEPAAPQLAKDAVMFAAGDIACDPSDPEFNNGLGSAVACQQFATSQLLTSNPEAKILALGDNQYVNGALTTYQQSFVMSWGRFLDRIYPVPGNHEYQTANASGYFDYFNGVGNTTGRAGERGKGYYSFDVQNWHIVALNSNCTIVSCATGSEQQQWLAQDLANNPKSCTLAYWHHPYMSSGLHGNVMDVEPLWQTLTNAKADVVLSGHDHDYERFAPENGIREFVVGTGGVNLRAFSTIKANSEIRINNNFGVLKLTLHSQTYDWQLLNAQDGSVADSGSGTCS